MRNTFGIGARPAMRSVFTSSYPSNVDVEHLYPTNWKMPKFDNFSDEEIENIVEYVVRFTAQCR